MKSSGSDAETRMAPKPPPDPNRQLSLTGSRLRLHQKLSRSVGDPLSPSDLGSGSLKSESLNDGITRT